MDTTDPGIIFDENGICNRCKKAEELLNIAPYSLTKEEKRKELEKLVKKSKKEVKERNMIVLLVLAEELIALMWHI